MDFFRFLLALMMAFYVPGNLLVRKIDFPVYAKIGLSLVLGLVMWGFQGFILGYLGWRQGTYLYLAVTTLFWIYLNRQPKFHLERLKIDWLFTLILVAGILAHVSAVWFIGTPTANGLLFCCRGVPDAIYHLALTNELIKNFPPFEPGMAGTAVKNYYYWSNLIMADTVRVFGTDLITTVYKFFPILLVSLLAAAVATFAHLLDLGKIYRRWLAIFVFFSGDILYLLTLFTRHVIDFKVNALDDATKLLAGPPRSFSIVVIFWAICVLIVWIKKRSFTLDLVLVLMFASLAGFKVYTSVFALIGLVFLAGYYFFKKDWQRLLFPMAVLVLSFLIYFPTNGAGNGLSFNFPWIFRETLARPQFGLVDWELRRRIFANDGKIFHAFLYEFYFAIVYFIFVFSTSLVALFQTKRTLNLLSKPLNIFLLSAIAVTTFLGFASSSKIGGANTIQFIIAQFFFLAIYAALALANLQARLRGRIKTIFVILVLALILPRAVHDTVENFHQVVTYEGYLVTNDQLGALQFLKRIPNGAGLILLDPNWARQETSLSVSFLADKPLFLAGYTGVLEDHQVNGARERLSVNQQIFSSNNKNLVRKLLWTNQISYIYLPATSNLRVEDLGDQISEDYQSPTVRVLHFTPTY